MLQLEVLKIQSIDLKIKRNPSIWPKYDNDELSEDLESK